MLYSIGLRKEEFSQRGTAEENLMAFITHQDTDHTSQLSRELEVSTKIDLLGR